MEKAVPLTQMVIELSEQISAIQEQLEQREFIDINETSAEIWTVADIAKYMKFTERTIRASVISDPTFPQPIAINSQRGNGPTRSLRYLSGEVVRFVKRKAGNRFI